MTLIDKAEAKAALQAWLDRHNYPVNPTLFHALDDLPARGVGVQDARDALEELANMPLYIPLEDWARLSARIFAGLAPTDAAQENKNDQ